MEDADGTVPTRLNSPRLEKTDEFFGDVKVYYNYADLRLLAERSFGSAASVTYQGCADAGLCYPPHTQNFLVDAASGANPRCGRTVCYRCPTAATTNTASNDDPALWLALLFAFMGGIILNAMPCTFPSFR